MWRILPALVTMGCGFRAAATVADDAGADATGGGAGSDAASDTRPPGVDCWSRWLDHVPLAEGSPTQLAGFATAGAERDPWLSRDGLRLYLARESSGSLNVHLATRGAVGEDFSASSEIVNLRTSADEMRPSLSGNELMLVLSTNGVAGRFRLAATDRAQPQDSFPSPSNSDHTMDAINTGNDDNTDPFLSSDGLALYFARQANGGDARLFAASRATLSDRFAAAAPLDTVNDGGARVDDADPAVSRDQRVLVFSSTRVAGAGANLFYATRESAAQPFGAPIAIPTVNGTADDRDPVLSDDGCELYFSSNRRMGDDDLYRARFKK